jgi:predicted nucleic acid-binding protein
LKTPDAIHAATALACGSAMFVTNDGGFRKVPQLPVVVLSEVAAS